jgi:hypothetical protein
LTIVVDDAGVGDLLFGVVIGAYRHETGEFGYEVIDVKYFRPPRFGSKAYLRQASKIVFRLLDRFKLAVGEPVQICRGYIFDEAVEDLKEKYGAGRIRRVVVTGEPQRLTEIAYLDELRNLGYEPVEERDKKRAESFFHMMNWLERNPDKLIYAKTGWPRLSKYRLFRSHTQMRPKKNRNRVS